MQTLKCTATGDWNTTELADGANQEVLAEQLFVDLIAGEWNGDEAINGGISYGGEMQAFVRLSDNPQIETALFPGRLEITTAKGLLVLENADPLFDFLQMRAFYSGAASGNSLVDITESVLKVWVNIDYPSNTQEVTLLLHKHTFLGMRDEIDDIALI